MGAITINRCGTENKNAFVDDSSEDGLSDFCRYFLAGQLAHAPAICALAAPTVNCAKRFKLYSFAPTNATWGIDNRTTGLRVKATRNESTHRWKIALAVELQILIS